MPIMLEAIDLCLTEQSNASVIWLHGLGADGHDFEPIVAALDLPGVRFILPHASYRAVSINNGYTMRAWYDIVGLSPNSAQDEAGIRHSQTEIEALISAEKARGIASRRIVLAGFSQGGAMALHTALRHAEPLAGVLALSAYLPLKAQLANEANIANSAIPIFMAHGSFDNVITLETAKLSEQVLKSQHYAVAWHEYPMAHSVSNQEIADIRLFLQSILAI
jgi:phospholipase/carboxylesterase